ncbi:MAG: hypothetical protein H0T89_25015 [Deltaproteobacteria bacterium]|nr:hypothetical protein [Deltaproteobacteria bacterium]MDQ3299706.1 hypothetical protein [Myxococcota bacterium]
MPDRTLIVSATNVLARGYYAVPTDRVSERGEPVNALFAVARGVVKAIAFKVPARAIAVIDAAPPSTTWPLQLQAQGPALRPLLEALGLPDPTDRGFGGDRGAALDAKLDRPYGIELSGNKLFISDSYNNRIRAVTLYASP